MTDADRKRLEEIRSLAYVECSDWRDVFWLIERLEEADHDLTNYRAAAEVEAALGDEARDEGGDLADRLEKAEQEVERLRTELDDLKDDVRHDKFSSRG